MKGLLIFVGLGSLMLGQVSRMQQARNLYDLTEFEQSLKILHAIPEKSGAVYELIGRNYFMLAEYKKATEALEKAVATDPRNSDFVLWLGRAYGRRAETSNFFAAPGHASKARQLFERSVQLNPRNIEALNDLLEYELEAPGFMGGGMERAEATADRIAQVNPAEGHWAHAKIAEKRKEFGSAEEQLRRAIELAPYQVGRFIDLARFLTKQGRYQEADQSLARAGQIAPDSPKLMYATADLYIESGRHLDVARELLKRYMSATVTPDDPPKSEAAKLLRKAGD
jgi:tetratricopeptide (TPR) repeat protein